MAAATTKRRTRKKQAGPVAETAAAPDVSQDTPALTELDRELQGIEWQEGKVECDLIDPHPANRRVTVPSVADLADSIRQTGQLLERVKIRDTGDGRYQMLGGQRRLTACSVILGWQAIEAEVCRCSDAVARALVSLLNSQRTDLNPIEQARDIEGLCRPAEAGGAGMTREAAAAVHGLKTGQAASNRLRLLELPAELQELVAAGRLPESYARVVIPWLPIGKPLVAWVAKEVAGWKEDQPTRREFETSLRRAVGDKLTRLMTPMRLNKYTSLYELQGCRCGRLFAADDALIRRLAPVTVPTLKWNAKKGETEERTAAIKLFDREQTKALPAAKQKLESLWRRSNAKAKGKKAAELTPAEKAAETKRKRKEADERAAKAVREWRVQRFTRCAIAATFAPGHERIPLALAAVMGRARKRRHEYGTDPAPHTELLVAACSIQAARQGLPANIGEGDEVPLSELRRCLADAREDPVTAAEELQCLLLQLYVWPQCEGHGVEYLVADRELPQCWRKMTRKQREQLRPVELLDLSDDFIGELAGEFGVSIAAAWKRSAIEGTRERLLVEEFFEIHTVQQLEDLANELCGATSFPVGSSKADWVSFLFSQHTSKGALPLPKCLQVAKKKRRS